VVHKRSIASDGTPRTYANLTGYAPLRRKKQQVVEVEDVEDIPF
jgi:hypothetical protein